MLIGFLCHRVHVVALILVLSVLKVDSVSEWTLATNKCYLSSIPGILGAAQFVVRDTRFISGFKLVHRSGGVSCHEAIPSTNFGCYGSNPADSSYYAHLSEFIVDQNMNAVAPFGGESSIPLFYTESRPDVIITADRKNLTLLLPTPRQFQAGANNLILGYGEALFSEGYNDNNPSTIVCVDIIAVGPTSLLDLYTCFDSSCTSCDLIQTLEPNRCEEASDGVYIGLGYCDPATNEFGFMVYLDAQCTNPIQTEVLFAPLSCSNDVSGGGSYSFAQCRSALLMPTPGTTTTTTTTTANPTTDSTCECKDCCDMCRDCLHCATCSIGSTDPSCADCGDCSHCIRCASCASCSCPARIPGITAYSCVDSSCQSCTVLYTMKQGVCYDGATLAGENFTGMQIYFRVDGCDYRSGMVTAGVYSDALCSSALSPPTTSEADFSCTSEGSSYGLGVCGVALSSSSNGEQEESSSSTKAVAIAVPIAAVVAIATVAICFFLVCSRKGQQSDENNREQQQQQHAHQQQQQPVPILVEHKKPYNAAPATVQPQPWGYEQPPAWQQNQPSMWPPATATASAEPQPPVHGYYPPPASEEYYGPAQGYPPQHAQAQGYPPQPSGGYYGYPQPQYGYYPPQTTGDTTAGGGGLWQVPAPREKGNKK